MTVTINPFYKRYDKLDKYVVVYVEINIDFHVDWEKFEFLTPFGLVLLQYLY